MIIECNSCSTKFRLDESKITGHGVKVRCTKCQSIFIVHAPEVMPESTPESTNEAPIETPAKTTTETDSTTDTTEPNPDTEEPATDDKSYESDESVAGFNEPTGIDGEFEENPGTDSSADTNLPGHKDIENEQEKGPSIGDLGFSLDEKDFGDTEDDEDLLNEENDFLLHGFNKALQGTGPEIHFNDDDIDINSAEFNLLNDSEDNSEPIEPNNDQGDFTFDSESAEATATATPLPDVEGKAVDLKAPERDAELSAAFEAVLKEAEEAVSPSKPEEGETAEHGESNAVPESQDEVRSAFEAAVSEGDEPAEGETETEEAHSADTEMRQLLNSALESVNEEENGRPEAYSTSEAGKPEEPQAPDCPYTNDEADTEEPYIEEDFPVPPYEVDKRGSRAPVILAILLIIGLGVLLHITGIADRVLNPSGTAGNELTMAITKMKSYVATNKEIGPVFVVEAKLLNMTDSPQKVEAVRGTLYNKSGKRLSARTVSPGRVVSKEQIRDMSRIELVKNFKDTAGGTIPPKGSVPVMLLFMNAPEATVEFSLDVLQ